GFDAISITSTTLLIRLRSTIAQEMARAANAHGSDMKTEPNKAVAERFLRALDSLAHLHMKVADIYARFEHVTRLSERRNRGAELGHDPARHGSRQAPARKTRKHRPEAAAEERRETLRIAIS